MRTDIHAPGSPQSDRAPRLQRSAAAVIAQYIQELTHPREPGPCLPLA